MSDYVNNDQQACFEDAFEPFDMSLGQPTTSEALDTFDWSQPSYEALANVDWAALHEEIMEDAFEDPAEGAQPGDRHYMLSLKEPVLHTEGTGPLSGSSRMEDHTVSPAGSQAGPFICQESGCTSRPFKRMGDFNRHNRKHKPVRLYDCPASFCSRIGKRGFTREDKLFDHMLAGHNEDDSFVCTQCGVSYIRAEFEIHSQKRIRPYARTEIRLNAYRTCPMPRCSFRVYVGYIWSPSSVKNMDVLREHLLQKHDLQARLHFTSLLNQRGYDARNGEIICPMCPVSSGFKQQEDFEIHLWKVHFEGSACSEHTSGTCEAGCFRRELWWRMQKCTSDSDTLRQHRHTISRIYPPFKFHPLWNDVKHCVYRLYRSSVSEHIGLLPTPS